MDGQLNFYWHQGIGWASQGGAKTTQPYSIVRWDFLGFNEQGGLTYADPTNTTVVATDPDGGAVAAIAPAEEGGFYVVVSGGSLERGQRHQGSGHRVVKFSATGEKLWEYHNVHNAFAWTSDAYTPGYLVGVFGSAGGLRELVPFTGYYGQYFLLDPKDGLFVDALGQDQRSDYTLDNTVVLTENFNGTLFRHPKSGKLYYLGGDADQRLWELTGVDTLKRETVAITVTPEQVAKAEQAAKHNFLAQQSASREVVYTDLPDAASNAPVIVHLLSDRSATVRGQIVRIAGRELSFVTHPMIARPVLTGVWDDEAVERAITLSKDKYCSATAMLGATAEITWDLTLQDSAQP
jgi:hypothetical protein